MSVQCCQMPRRLLPIRAMTVMHSETLSPDAASRLHSTASQAPVARNIRKAKRLAAYLNALRPLRPHILQRYLHRGNRYLLARSMSPDPSSEGDDTSQIHEIS
jgi:hypothetical protein